jgi:hypothetical protein
MCMAAWADLETSVESEVVLVHYNTHDDNPTSKTNYVRTSSEPVRVERTGLILLNAEAVISKLNVRLRTPTLPTIDDAL